MTLHFFLLLIFVRGFLLNIHFILCLEHPFAVWNVPFHGGRLVEIVHLSWLLHHITRKLCPLGSVILFKIRFIFGSWVGGTSLENRGRQYFAPFCFYKEFILFKKCLEQTQVFLALLILLRVKGPSLRRALLRVFIIWTLEILLFLHGNLRVLLLAEEPLNHI